MTGAERMPLRNAEIETLDLVDDRDRAQDAADKLADAIATILGVEIGEHSNMNDPWQNALTSAETAIAQPRRLMDRALEVALPISGGRDRPLLKRLSKELARVDRMRAEQQARSVSRPNPSDSPS